jgi:hypothetical protein
MPKAVQKTRDVNISAGSAATVNDTALTYDPRSLIQPATQRAATAANSKQTMLY